MAKAKTVTSRTPSERTYTNKGQTKKPKEPTSRVRTMNRNSPTKR